MPEDTSIGQRIQSIRKRRGLTQTELATASGVSVSLIRQIEQGQRDDTRLETARKLAAALRVPTSFLLAGPDAAPPASDDADQWEPVRRALEGRPVSPATGDLEPPTAEGVSAALDKVVALVLASQYAAVRRALPALLRDADALVAGAASGTGADARRLRSKIRQLTAYMLGQTWQFTAADEAISLAIDDASDPLTAMAAADWQCWALLRQGRLAEASALAARWADDAEPRISRATADDLTAWGRFLILVSTTAIRDNRPGEARDALKLARVAATAVGRDVIPAFNPWQVFGPATVAMVRAENAAISDRPDLTLSVSAHVGGQGFPVPRNWNRHQLDVAHAHATMRQYGEATDVLQHVRRTAPEWLAQQRYARDITRDIIARRRTLTPEMRDLAAFVQVPL